MREMTLGELANTIADKEEELANLRFQMSLHQLDNTIQVRHVRRELARMNTIMQEHNLGIRISHEEIADEKVNTVEAGKEA
ncbi:MAG: 50S ribosomal protein L29 [Candidatus Electryoneaceae bacterium]|nr:50S ribosomal protein L29 [Candidatus Electryoneaceae bacterium]